MEIPYDFEQCWETPIQKLDRAALIRFHPRRYWAVEKTLDKMGQLSAQAQGLKRVLTTYDKVVDSEEDQTVYILWEKNETKPNTSNIIGLLKVGRKHLYLMGEEQKQYEENPLCVLDFYIHETKQRQGFGHALFDYMLVTEVVQPYEIAVDRPSDSFVNFLGKHYQLHDPIWQNTNYVVYPLFFDGKLPKELDERWGEHKRSEKSQKTSACPSPSPRRSTPSARRETASGIIHGDLPLEPRAVHGPDTPQGRKNTRDFGHTHLW